MRARRFVAAVILAVVATAVAFAAAPPAGAATSVVLTGHGFGHGRGLGQWGSLGYALQGSSSAQILDHFYGGTVAGQVGDSQMSVSLEASSGRPLRVQVADGGLAIDAGAGPAVAPGRAVMLERVGSGSFRISDAASCAGPWTARPTPVAASTVRVLATRGLSTSAEYGFPSDLALTGDWNGDRVDSIGVFRPGGPYGGFYFRNANSNGPTDVAFEFGFGTDIPIVGDWNGDGIDSAGVFRPGPGPPTFYLRNSLSNGPPAAAFALGLAGDIPIVGDWNGDGVDSVGVFRPGGPNGAFYLRNALSNGPVDAAFGFGFGSDLPVVGDWDGVGADGIGVRRDNTFFLRNALSNGPVDASYQWRSAARSP